MLLGGGGALKQLSVGKTESKLHIFCSGLIQRVSAMLPMSLPQTEYTNGHFMDSMHRFDIFLMFSITLHLRIIDFSMSGQLRTYVWTFRQKSGHMSGRPDMKIAWHLGSPLKVHRLRMLRSKNTFLYIDFYFSQQKTLLDHF